MAKGYLSSEKNMIALGRMHKVNPVHKFGARIGISNGSAKTIWDGDGLFPWDSFTFSNIINPLLVTGASDAGKSITLYGLDGGDLAFLKGKSPAKGKVILGLFLKKQK